LCNKFGFGSLDVSNVSYISELGPESPTIGASVCFHIFGVVEALIPQVVQCEFWSVVAWDPERKVSRIVQRKTDLSAA
jgi:hypothetical protein